MKIIYTTETGIAIIHPTGELGIDEVFNKDVPEEYKATAKIVEDDVIPTDRTFRNAWEHSDGKIIENVDKAKEIHKDKLRAERTEAFKPLDVEFMKSFEQGTDTKDILKEKQRLRDITKLVDKCRTIDEIKSVTINSKAEIVDAEIRDTVLR